MKFILGKKLKMSQIFADNGTVTPVTVVEAGPCQVAQIRTLEKDGYSAVQIGFGEKKKLNKPLGGHLKGLPKFRYLSEFRLNPLIDSSGSGSSLSFKRGDEIGVGTFEAGDKVKVSGVSKGKGFQGVVKRHGFHGSPASHGHKDQLRMPGSIGSTDPARVFPGMRMAGRMGGEQVTVTNLEIAKVDEDKNLLYIKGAIPGVRNGLLEISGEGEMDIQDTSNKKQDTNDVNLDEKKKSDEKRETKKQERRKEKGEIEGADSDEVNKVDKVNKIVNKESKGIEK